MGSFRFIICNPVHPRCASFEHTALRAALVSWCEKQEELRQLQALPEVLASTDALKAGERELSVAHRDLHKVRCGLQPFVLWPATPRAMACNPTCWSLQPQCVCSLQPCAPTIPCNFSAIPGAGGVPCRARPLPPHGARLSTVAVRGRAVLRAGILAGRRAAVAA